MRPETVRPKTDGLKRASNSFQGANFNAPGIY
jgi:hypothetical protein